jgi:hypothetical protein
MKKTEFNLNNLCPGMAVDAFINGKVKRYFCIDKSLTSHNFFTTMDTFSSKTSTPRSQVEFLSMTGVVTVSTLLDSEIFKVYKDYRCEEVVFEKEIVFLNDVERTILSALTKYHPYIARGSNGALYLFRSKPTKGDPKGDGWEVSREHDKVDFCEFNYLFKSLEYHLYAVEDLLNNRLIPLE